MLLPAGLWSAPEKRPRKLATQRVEDCGQNYFLRGGVFFVVSVSSLVSVLGFRGLSLLSIFCSAFSIPFCPWGLAWPSARSSPRTVPPALLGGDGVVEAGPPVGRPPLGALAPAPRAAAELTSSATISAAIPTALMTFRMMISLPMRRLPAANRRHFWSDSG